MCSKSSTFALAILGLRTMHIEHFLPSFPSCYRTGEIMYQALFAFLYCEPWKLVRGLEKASLRLNYTYELRGFSVHVPPTDCHLT